MRAVLPQMKALLALLICATTCSAIADDYVSAPYGIIRITIPATSSYTRVSMPFETLDSDINILFDGQLTGAAVQSNADNVFLYDTNSATYTNAYLAAGTTNPAWNGTWFVDFTSWVTSPLSINLADGLFIKTVQTNAQNLWLFGRVPMAATNSVPIASGFQKIGYPYPAPIALQDTDFASDGATWNNSPSLTDRTTFYFPLYQDTNSQTYGIWSDDQWWKANDLAEWNAGILASNTIMVGESFWYSAQNSFTWTEVRPYTNVYAPGTGEPRVVSFSMDTNTPSLTLTIETTGDAGEEIDIFYQDFDNDETLDALGWAFADTNIATSGQTSTNWTDSSTNRPALDAIFGRFYLISRADIDDDGDELSNARELFIHFTDMSDADSDDDMLDDGEEILTYGSDPHDIDSDNDGMGDGAEAFLGFSPTVSNAHYTLPFAEGFESPEVTNGLLSTQRGWMVESGPIVQTNSIYAGAQALQLTGAADPDRAKHPVATLPETTVWTDLRVIPEFRGLSADPALESTSAVELFVNLDGYVTAYDGLSAATSKWTVFTNITPVATSQWIRITTKQNFTTKKYDLWVEDVRVGAGLGFANTAVSEYWKIDLEGGSTQDSFVDSISVSTNEPAGLDNDGDGMPNSWENQHSLDPEDADDGVEDADDDGLDNVGEYLAGTDPNDSDSDNDGMGDGAESDHGFNPASSNVFTSLPFADLFALADYGYLAPSLNGIKAWVVQDASNAVARFGFGAPEVELAAEIAPVTNVVEVDHFFGAETVGTVWVDLYGSLVTRDLDAPPALDASAASPFYLNSSGQIVVYDGSLASNNWIVLTNHTAVSESTWHRYTRREVYSNQTWSLWLDNVQLTNGLGLATDRKEYSRFRMIGCSVVTSLLDSVTVSASEPVGLDNDGDGMPNSWETQYALNPDSASDATGDADSDGVNNLTEYQNGTDPTDADSFDAIPFIELFETNTVSAGEIDGQNGWVVTTTGLASVVTQDVYEGAQSLSISTSTNADVVTRFAGGRGIDDVWADFYAKSTWRDEDDHPSVHSNAVTAYYINTNGHVVVYDGSNWTTVTNVLQTNETEYIRHTIKYEYPDQEWALWLDRELIAEDLGFASETEFFTQIDFPVPSVGTTQVDNLRVLTNDAFLVDISGVVTYVGPQTGDITVLAATFGADWTGSLYSVQSSTGAYTVSGLATNVPYWLKAYVDSDGDGVRDPWEAQGVYPSNSVSLTDAASGYDIALSDPDEDLDGLPDWWEMQIVDDSESDRFDDPALVYPDADFDGDGISNIDEYNLDTDPASDSSVPTKLAFSTNEISVSELITNTTITLELSDNPSAPVGGLLYVDAGTAINGTDYGFTNISFSFPTNITSTNFNLQIIPNNELEPREWIRFMVSVTNGPAVIGARNRQVVFIDDEAADTDGDGIADWWENLYFGNLTTANATSDYDSDGVSDLNEFLLGRNPLYGASPDTNNVLKLNIFTPLR